MAMRVGLTKALRTTATAAARRSSVRTFAITPHAADNFVIDFPEEREGLHFEFNWSLAQDDVTPHGDAFQNLRWSKLEEFAKDAKQSAGQNVSIKEVDVDVPFTAYEPLYEQVVDHLSSLDNIFAQDGAVGSFKDDRTRVRVVTDSPSVALYAQNFLVKVPTKDPHADRPIVVYVASTGEFADQEPSATLLLDRNDDEELFVKVVLTGDVSLASVQDAVAAAKKRLVEESSESVVLPGDVLLKDDASVLLFNASDATRAQAVNSKALYASNGSIWSQAGLTSLFGGAVVDSKKLEGKKKNVLQLTDAASSVHVPCNNLVDAPKTAIFMEKGASAKGKAVQTEEAIKKLTAMDSSLNAEKLEALLSKSEVKSYVVSDEASVQDILGKL